MRDLSMLCAGSGVSICVAAGWTRRCAWYALRLNTRSTPPKFGPSDPSPPRAGQLREVEESIWKSLRIDPDNAQCWIGLASVNNRLLRPQSAKFWKAAIRPS
jgi:hypothetical protein